MAAAMHALVRVGLAPVRAKPNVRSEQVSQEVLGSALEVLQREDEWARVRGEDGYEGWIGVGGLITCDRSQVDDWLSGSGGARAVALDATVEDVQGRVLARLPWGARVSVAGSNATLPDGRSGRLREGAWILEAELVERCQPSGSTAVRTAMEWLGVPYLWGGRTRWGADCSGLIQAVYRLHGALIPRDSYQQTDYGEPIEPGRDFGGLKTGDLIFFRAEDSEHIVHVAISLGGPEILHSAEVNGCVALNSLVGDSGLERALARRAVGARRVFAD